MNYRIQMLRNKMAGLNLQGMIIKNPINVKYLTRIEAEGELLITRKENIYITDARYIEHVKSILTPFDEIVVADIRSVSKDDYENFFLFCENVGFEENFVTYADYKEYMHKYYTIQHSLIMDQKIKIKSRNYSYQKNFFTIFIKKVLLTIFLYGKKRQSEKL